MSSEWAGNITCDANELAKRTLFMFSKWTLMAVTHNDLESALYMIASDWASSRTILNQEGQN